MRFCTKNTVDTDAGGSHPGAARESILAAASSLFAAGGYESTSVTDIARKARISKSLVFYYYKEKQEILGALVDEFVNKSREFGEEFVARKARYIEKLKDNDIEKLKGDDFKALRREHEEISAYRLKFLEANRDILCVVFMEVFKSQNDGSLFFDLMDRLTPDTIKEHARYKSRSRELNLVGFFFLFTPSVVFACLAHKWAASHRQDLDALREEFTRADSALFMDGFMPNYGTKIRYEEYKETASSGDGPTERS